ncbi:MAG: thioredoxin domain-containing protein [Caldilineaceae bacterium]
MSRKERAQLRQQRANVKQKQRLFTTLGIALFLLFLGYVTWQQTSGGDALAPETVPDPAIGPADAVVEVVEYADFGCPACRAWHNSSIREQMFATFGDQVRFVWKDFPIITALSPKAAEAGHCAAAQGKFWEYHDYLYEQATGLEVDQLKQYGDAVGLDAAQFAQCLDSGMMVRKVRAGEQEARRLGLRATPGFAINGRPLNGAPTFEILASVIQQALGN